MSSPLVAEPVEDPQPRGPVRLREIVRIVSSFVVDWCRAYLHAYELSEAC